MDGDRQSIVRTYPLAHIRDFQLLKDVADLNDPRIVEAVIRGWEDDVHVIMPDLAEQGFVDLCDNWPEDEDSVRQWALELYEDLAAIGIVATDIHSNNIMIRGDELKLIDYEQFWPLSEDYYEYGKWRLKCRLGLSLTST